MSVLQNPVASLCAACGLSLLACSDGIAVERYFVGPRALGMGGAGVAATRDFSAQYLNPAAFGFMWRRPVPLPAARRPAPPAAIAEEEAAVAAQDPGGNGDGPEDPTANGPAPVAVVDPQPLAEPVLTPPVQNFDNTGLGDRRFGIGGDFQAGVRVHGPISQILDNIDEIEQFELASNVQLSPDQTEDAVRLLSQLVSLDTEGLGISVNVNGGIGARIGHFGVGVRGWADMVGFVTDIDRVNVGLEDTQTLINALADNADQIVDADLGAYQVQTLSPQQQADLSAAGYDTNAQKAIDYVVSDLLAEGVISAGDVDESIATIVDVPLAPIGSLDDNSTSVILHGLGVAEIPVSYGYAWDDSLAVGATLRLMRGRVYGTNVRVFDDGSEDVIEVLDEEYEESFNVALDIAAMYRQPKYNLGISIRNINSPSFDGFTAVNGRQIRSIEIEPSIVVGGAWVPIPTLTIEADFDVIPYDDLIRGRELQYGSLGVEWEPIRFISLRGGGFTNLAESESNPTLTAGFGLNFHLFRLDLAGAYGLDEERYEDKDLPGNARVALGLQVDW